ncbi:MAG: prepilin-type N-terminal cleavage/methylation domain-containing protein, partial [Phycisphaerae bacterium]|nr:prepilin-type N-terminal cleavage/methylation domain-containing protein [Phycisphaerae bacterium]
MRRGFTVIELVLALVLAAIVVMSALSVTWVLTSTDQRLARQFDD